MVQTKKKKRNFWVRFLKSLDGRQRLILLAIVLIPLLLLLANVLFPKNKEYGSLYREACYEGCFGTGVSCMQFDDGFLMYSRNGFYFVDSKGRQKWNQAAPLDSPSAELRGSYGIICDLRGTRAFIFDKSGVLCTISPTQPILNMSLSEQGVAALVLDDGSATRIDFYDKKGKRLDIELSLEMAVSGYPVDIALSPDGNGLAVSMTTSSSGIIKSRLVFYNFSTGKNVPNRLVGYFEFEETLFPEIRYLNSGAVAAVGDSRIVFMDLSNEVKPALKAEYKPEGRLQSVAVAEEKVAFVENDVKGDIYLRVLDAEGSELLSRLINERCDRLSLSSDAVLLQAEDRLSVWDMKNRPRFEGKLTQEGPDIFLNGKSQLIQFSGSDMYVFRMK